MLANVSHELRTPLNVVVGYSASALNTPNRYGVDAPQALRHDFQQIYQAGDHLIRLINDLLDLSRAEINELDLFPEPIDTHSFLVEVFQSMQKSLAAPGDVKWRLDLPSQLPLIHADPVRLRQALLNLLSNAQKFTDQGQIILGAEVAPPHLHMWVHDTGAGIPIDLQEQIFEPFVTSVQAKRRPEGVGLGLSITRRLVALHGGSMSLESQPDQGSTFHVYIPLPSLAGQLPSIPPSARPALVLIAAHDQPVAPVIDLCRRQGWAIEQLRPGDDLQQQLREIQPVALAWDLALSALAMRQLGWPLWGATALTLALLLAPGVAKWRADARRHGRTVMVLSVLLATQGFHGVEHVTQWLQYHVLNWSMRASTGLLSAANSEWVHFVWNWLVLLCVIYLICGGVRNVWMWLLLAWALAHTFEHTYLFVRFLELLDQLRRMGVTNVTAQGLPGILGQDGWLARSTVTQGTFLCRLPGVTTAVRLDVHFWWNIGETALLLLAAHTFLASRQSTED